MLRATTLLTAMFLAACSQPTAPAGSAEIEAVAPPTAWSVNANLSHLSFISIKSGAIGETHYFSGLSGRYDSDGLAVITIALDTIETGIDIRNTRMREHLFETDSFPSATITTKLSPAGLQSLSVSTREQVSLPISLNLHGQSVDYDILVHVTRIDNKTVIVSSRQPIIINAEDFGLLAGIETLRELANLPEITPVVPVSFSVVFESGA